MTLWLKALVADPLEFFKLVVTPDKLRISEAYRQRANVWSDVGVMAETAWALIPASWREWLWRPAYREQVAAPALELMTTAGPSELA
jgi:hypothetical protein